MSPRRPLITLYFTTQLYPAFCFILFSLCCRSLAQISMILWSFSLKKKKFSFSLITHFLELSLVKGNKRESGREDRGRDDRWGDRVKGGFCLINCFSGASLAHFCGIVKFMIHAGKLISPPLVLSSASALFLKGLAAACAELSQSFPVHPPPPRTPF